MTDPRFITEGDGDEWAAYHTNDTMTCMLLDHAAYMDERDARQRDLIRDLGNTVEACEQVIEVGKANETRQRDLIRRLAEAIQEDLEWCESVGREPCRTCKLITEARGIEAPNE